MEEFRLHLRRQGIVARSIDQHCRRLKKLQPYSHNALNKHISLLNAANANKYLQTAKHWCDFKKIPYESSFFKRIPEKSAMRPTFSKEEIDAFLALPVSLYRRDAIETHRKWQMFWTIVSWTSARPGEIAALRVQDVDLASNAFVFPFSKTGTGRIVAIHQIIREQVKEYVEGRDGQLFTYRGSTISNNAWLKDFRLRISALGITKEVDPYSLRISFISGALNNGGGLLDVQDIAGHSDPKTTRIYKRGNLQAQIAAMNQYPFIRDKIGLTAVQDTWEKLRTELLQAHVAPVKVAVLEQKFFECIELPQT